MNQAQGIDLKTATVGMSTFDLIITSTMSSTVNVEFFNNDLSCTKIYNPASQPGAAQQFHPVSAPGVPRLIPIGDQTAGTSWVLAYVVGGLDTFVSAVKGVPTIPAGTNTKSYVFFDENGQLVYQPGYVNGALDSGNVTVQSGQTNYRHIFEVAGKAAFDINIMRMTVGNDFTTQLQKQFTYLQQNIVASGSNVPFTPSTYSSELNNQANIITFPVAKQINAKTGLSYPVIGKIGGNANVINLSVFFTPKTANMLSLM